MFPDEQLHRNRSASQGQVGVVDSRGLPLGGVPPRGCPSRPWARLDLSSDTTLSVTSFSDQYWGRRRPWPPEGLLEHVQHLATSILVLNSVTLTNSTSSSQCRGNRERPVRGLLRRP